MKWGSWGMVLVMLFVDLALLPSSALASPVWKVQASFGSESLGETVIGGSLSCASQTSCVAIVNAVQGESAEAWSGLRWSPRPLARVPDPILYSVSCVRGGCVAVGSYSARCKSACPATTFSPKGTHYQSRALVERLARGRWAVQRAPSPGIYGTGLLGVSCASVRACISVGLGYVAHSYGGDLLVERFDGRRWTAQTLALPPEITRTPGYNGAALTGVSCPSASACVAVGSYNIGFPPARATLFAEDWDGTSWTFQALTAVSNPEGSAEVSCSSMSACMIVGPRWHTAGADGGHPFAERWNGVSWSTQTVPAPRAQNAALVAVSCPTAHACTAVGHASRDALVEHWNGVQWGIRRIPNPRSSLLSVSCTKATTCTTLGDYGGQRGAFIDRYS